MKSKKDAKLSLADICASLRSLQRQRVCCLSSRIRFENRLRAQIATAFGYSAGCEEKDRKERMKKADAVIKRTQKDHNYDPCGLREFIVVNLLAIQGCEALTKRYDADMLRLAKLLPVAKWTAAAQQRGFGLGLLAQIVGECGDLNGYANPGKLWKRMGCAPYESRGKVRMPSTWRMREKPGLTADDWTELGYSPRRRSLAYLIGEGLIKQNKSIYRKRYDQAKATAAEKHPEWANPKTPGKGLHYNYHGNLLAAKLLLKNLWIEWTGGNESCETELISAAGLLNLPSPNQRRRAAIVGEQETATQVSRPSERG